MRAVAIIKSYQHEIKTVEDLRNIEGLSRAMAERVREIMTTGGLRKVAKMSNREEVIVCKELEKVIGVGSKRAKEFYEMGIKTVSDLKKRPQLITKNM